MKLKPILTNWRVIVLLIFLLMAIVAIKPQWSSQGIMVRSVELNSSAANAGIKSPTAQQSPLQREKIITLDNNIISSTDDYHQQVQLLTHNQTVTLRTNKGIYTLQTSSLGPIDLGLKVSPAATSNIRKGLDLEGGTRVLLKAAEKISDDDLEVIISNLKERLNVYGLSDVIVRPASDLSGEKFILVEIAGVTEEEVKELLARQGKFEAKIANETVFLGGKRDVTYVCRSADCSGIDPSRGCSKTAEGYACSFFFTITLSPDAAERQAKATGSLATIPEGASCYLSQDLLLYLDDKEVDSLKIGCELKGRATTQVQVSGSGVGRTQAEATSNTLQNMKRLQTVLITGSLPVKLEVAKLDTISPSLGKEFINNILVVGALALAAVISVISIRYRKLNVIIPIALTLISEVILILGFAALVGWNLDLAAIAGIIVSIGTGVDHLVIITDETLRGEIISNWKQRLKNAMFIVIGAYLTVLAGMLPLWFLGAGLLKGFAFTTIAGLSFGVLIARSAYAAIVEKLVSE